MPNNALVSERKFNFFFFFKKKNKCHAFIVWMCKYAYIQIPDFIPSAASKELAFYISNSVAWVIFVNISSMEKYAKFMIYEPNHNILLKKS